MASTAQILGVETNDFLPMLNYKLTYSVSHRNESLNFPIPTKL